MRKICLLSIVLFIVCAINAQTTFSAPTPTMEQQYSLAKNFMYNSILTAITVAKSEGMAVEEYSKKIGIAVQSSKGNGKDFILALAMVLFLFLFHEARGIATANSDQQLKNVLWSQLSRIIKLSKVVLFLFNISDTRALEPIRGIKSLRDSP